MQRSSWRNSGGLPAACAVAILALVVAAGAAAEGPISVRLEAARVVVGDDGKEQLEPTDAVRPGEIIEYRATYTNRGSETVNGLLGTLPIPANTVYLDTTASPGAVEASLDGSRFAPVPLMRTVVREDGSETIEPVPAAEYRVLRWKIGELAQEHSAAVSARVTVPFSPVAAQP